MSEGKDFSEEVELDLIRARYKNVQDRFPLTLMRLQQSKEFEKVYRECKEAGLKDWHILQSIAGITVNYRMGYGKGFNSFEDMKEAYLDKFFQKETEADSPVPIAEFSFDNIQFHLDTVLSSYLGQKGYVIKSRTPDFKKLRKFADSKYKYFQLDVAHDPLFKCKSQDMVSQKAVSEHKPTVRWLLLTFVGSIEDAPAVKTVAQPLTLLWLPG